MTREPGADPLRKVLYFAYGSNLDYDQMRRRCPSAEPVDRARLADYRLVFPLFDETWRGGVASIAPHPGTDVEGVLYRMTEEDFDELDDHEDVDRGDYARHLVSVEDSEGAIARAWAYISPTEPGHFVPPSFAYVAAMVRGARAHGLSADYVARLRTIPSVQPERTDP